MPLCLNHSIPWQSFWKHSSDLPLDIKAPWSVKVAFSRVRVIIRPGHLRAHSSGGFSPRRFTCFAILQMPECSGLVWDLELCRRNRNNSPPLGTHRFISLPSSNEHPTLNPFGCFSYLLLFGGYQVPRDTRWLKSGSWASRNYPRNSSSIFPIQPPLQHTQLKINRLTRWLPMNPPVLPA